MMTMWIFPYRWWLVAGILLAGIVISVFVARGNYVRKKVESAFPTHSEYAVINHSPSKKSENAVVVMFGDSRIAKWSLFPDANDKKFINRGTGGDTTAQMRLRFKRDVIAFKPDIVVIQGGINDLVAASLSSKHRAQIIANLKENLSWMVKQASEAGISVALLTIVRPSSPPLLRRLIWSDDIYGLVDEVNSHIRTLHQLPKIRVIEFDKILNPEGKPTTHPYAEDTLHWTRPAYEKLNNHLAKEW